MPHRSAALRTLTGRRLQSLFAFPTPPASPRSPTTTPTPTPAPSPTPTPVPTPTPTPSNPSSGIGLFDSASGTWYLRKEDSAGAADAGQFAYGSPGWEGVVGDWNGDGVVSVGVVDPAGYQRLLSFTLEDGVPRWRFDLGDIVLERESNSKL